MRKSMHRKRLIIINSEQFGYNNATYYYCKYLKSKFDITYIGWDKKFDPICMNDVNICLVSRDGGLVRVIRYIRTVLVEVGRGDAIILMKYVKYISLLVRILCSRNTVILDIRTGSVSVNKYIRKYEDYLLRLEAKFFSNVTIISDGLAKKLYLNNKAVLLPLGAEEIANTEHNYSNMRMLYVGTLHNRSMDLFVKGVAKFHREYAHIPLSLTIVGDGLRDEIVQLRDLIKNEGLVGVAVLVGRIPHDQLAPYFESHNVGISYIPLTDYYDVQPSTKTFEYLLSGMAVIATSTSENCKVIMPDNGVLIDESVNGVADGILALSNNFNKLSSRSIRKSACGYRWSTILGKLADYIDSAI